MPVHRRQADLCHPASTRSKCTLICAQLLIPAELAHDTVEALGEVGQLQFKDLNTAKSAFQRTYANQVTPATDALLSPTAARIAQQEGR